MTKTLLDMARSKHVRSEKDEERAGDDMMARLGFAAVRFSQPRASMQTPGIPDRRYYHRIFGAIWWEAKTEKGEQSQAQADFQAMAEWANEPYVLGPCRILESFIAWHLKDDASSDRPDTELSKPFRYKPPKSRAVTRVADLDRVLGTPLTPRRRNPR